MGKAVSYSYPSSPNARRFGFAEEGCYTVSLNAGNEPPAFLAGFETVGEAKAYADKMPEEYHAHSLCDARSMSRVVGCVSERPCCD